MDRKRAGLAFVALLLAPLSVGADVKEVRLAVKGAT